MHCWVVMQWTEMLCALWGGDAVDRDALLLMGEDGQALGHGGEPLPPCGTASRRHEPYHRIIEEDY